MKINYFDCKDSWQEVKNATMTTINKDGGKYPESEWKRKLILSEHSPIRKIWANWKWTDLKSWVSVHFVRHKFGIDHWVCTQRTDRTGINRDESPQGALVMHECQANAQALINISRKRLCSCASKETREAWQAVKDEVAKVEPELASCMVRECVYRGFCPEMFGCGYDKKPEYLEELRRYRYGDIKKGEYGALNIVEPEKKIEDVIFEAMSKCTGVPVEYYKTHYNGGFDFVPPNEKCDKDIETLFRFALNVLPHDVLKEICAKYNYKIDVICPRGFSKNDYFKK